MLKFLIIFVIHVLIVLWTRKEVSKAILNDRINGAEHEDIPVDVFIMTITPIINIVVLCIALFHGKSLKNVANKFFNN